MTAFKLKMSHLYETDDLFKCPLPNRFFSGRKNNLRDSIHKKNSTFLKPTFRNFIFTYTFLCNNKENRFCITFDIYCRKHLRVKSSHSIWD